MRKHRIGWLLGLWMACGSAVAQPGPPFLTPAHPTPSDTILINAYTGPCDSLESGLLPTEIATEGNAVTVLMTGIDYTDPELCFFSAGVASVPIGRFPAGSYVVTITWQYSFLGEWVQVPLGVLPLTVAVSPPVAAVATLPTANGYGLTILAFALIAVALVTFKRRHLV